MDQELYDIKRLIYNLESDYFKGREVEVLDKLIENAENMKEKYINMENNIVSNKDIQLEKISEEIFMYKPVMTKNYYEGDYLERFGEIRTTDLKSSKLLEIHNEFWRAYEVQKGNIFASVPKALANSDQVRKLEVLGWDDIKVDVYEVKVNNLNRQSFIKYVEKTFKNHIIVLEVYNDINIILNYNV